MAHTQIELAVTLTEISCGCCGGVYALNERYRQHAQDNGKCWHCPYCAVEWGYVKGELQKERERHQATLARLNEASAEKMRLENKLKRVQRGVCPHCKRTFPNLARHMKCKHAQAA